MSDDGDPPRVTITAITDSNRARQVIIATSDGGEYSFDRESILVVGLREGAPFDDHVIASLEEAEQRVTVHDAALRLLNRRERSEREMRTRLGMRGFNPAVVDEEIVRLRDVGLLDDARFARIWVEERLRSAPRSRRMLRYELAAKGIASAVSNEATRGVDDQESADALAQRKAAAAGATPPHELRRAISAFLQRRGYSYDVIATAVSRAMQLAPIPD